MKHPLAVPSFVLLACLALCVAAASPAQPPAQDGGEGDEPLTPLAAQMEDLEAHLAKLRRTLRDETKREESLGHISAIQSAVVASKAERPVMTDGQPEAEQAAFVTAYRREMVGMLKELCELEVAVLDGNTDLARTLFKAIKKLEDGGHERFTEDG
ncbi:MAG: hypothetical protein QF903_02790 [Planctomycetota bacterium]|jgi:cell division septum initiation protein DivIVA|nr:hypothetical protein [Planctomycetota bacterium]MDP6764231.1 hypothetical protein [Planctomycetota bacterium]MDP6988389.1 hypothetical protein [Planctomycetota bacterium]